MDDDEAASIPQCGACRMAMRYFMHQAAWLRGLEPDLSPQESWDLLGQGSDEWASVTKQFSVTINDWSGPSCSDKETR